MIQWLRIIYKFIIIIISRLWGIIIKNEILSKILSKSGQFRFYKKNYLKFKKSNKKFKKQNAQLKKKNKKLNNDLKISNANLDITGKKLGKYTKPKIIEKLNNEEYDKLTIAIKCPSPKASNHWGDYFFALALKKSFEKIGFYVVIHEREDWYSIDDEVDINIVLRGVVDFRPSYDKINVMWNISHPDMVSLEEYDKYDISFIASEKYAKIINNKIDTTVIPLLQCTDPSVFYPEKDDEIEEEILFVGITRGIFREIVKDVTNTNHKVSVYGMGWKKFIDEEYIKGEFIPNKDLHKYYSSCKILLNDHWEDMKIKDFPSNRLFDALACGTFIISDQIPSADSLFEGNIITYDSIEDLNYKLDYFLTNNVEREKIAKKGQEIVLKNHTFDNRAEKILECLKDISLDNI